MLTVMVVIAVIASLVVAVAGFVNSTGAKKRSEGEIAALSAACESYKADVGSYPRHGAKDDKDFEGETNVTDGLDPRVDGDPGKGDYKRSSLFLYSELSGDRNVNGKLDITGTDPEPNKGYMEFTPSLLKTDKATKAVKYIQDPFGNSYGYSTRNAKQELEFQALARKDKASADRRTIDAGYNPTFDLWSTGGTVGSPEKNQAKWIKNWQ